MQIDHEIVDGVFRAVGEEAREFTSIDAFELDVSADDLAVVDSLVGGAER